MAGMPFQSNPTTPKKKDPRGLDQLIDGINKDYGLDIPTSDPLISPRTARALGRNGPEDVIHIRKGLHRVFFRKDGNPIPKILEEFNREAIAALGSCRTGLDKWLKQPQEARAKTPREKQVLESLLLKILDQAAPAPTGTAKRLFRRAQTGPAAYADQSRNAAQEEQHELSITAPGTQVKRPSDDWSSDSSSSKRVKGLVKTLERPRSAASVLDSVPVRTKEGPSGQDNSSSLYVSLSANTSKTSFKSDIFSGPDDDSRSSSQTTFEGISQELKQVQKAQRSSQDQFPITSSHIQALNESFSLHETKVTPTDYSDIESSHVKRHDHEADGSLFVNDPFAQARSEWPVRAETRTSMTIRDRLIGIWPSIPVGLENAPFPILWEVTRIALHCNVDLQAFTLKYERGFHQQKTLRHALNEIPSFQGKTFPPQSNAEAWQVSLSHSTPNGRAVVFSGSLDLNQDKGGPLFSLRLHPLALDDSYRLSRRFGSDRFLELVCPSLYSNTIPEYLKGDDNAIEEVINWLTRGPHWLVGRRWAPFYLKDVGYKKPPKEVRLGLEPPKAVVKDRVYFFAEDGISFEDPPSPNALPSREEVKSSSRTRMMLPVMLEWALELTQNTDQPCLKLFQRIALVLSKTRPTIVFRPDQIRHHKVNKLSTTGNVMNDGAGQMSRGVALKIRDLLGLPDIPSAVQGRLGSAKGMWVVDVTDKSDDLWIDTYPSQRKWTCSGVDDDHRTLEIRGYPREPRSAHFNLQLLPVLEDRARNKQQFREKVGGLLQKNLQEDLSSMRTSMCSTIQFRQWVHENSSCRHDRIERGEVPFLGGLPEQDEEVMAFLVDGGFGPMKQKYLQDLAWQAQKRKCDDLQKRLKIKIELSAYLYMIPDFRRLLKEGEVHIGFSSKFTNGDTILHDVDLLVARNPAHFNSDVRKVKARFIPELHFLKDVIIFSTKGDRPLADWLSGGDYDGDMAWLCWDPVIVDNFENAPLPQSPDLFGKGYLRKDKETLGDLINRHGMPRGVTEVLVKSFRFNMRDSLLGICTNYKERMCYERANINDKHAITMSTLVSHLVDQAKQGIIFTVKDFNRLRRDYLNERRPPDEPAYKYDSWNWKSGEPHHIIDYLKFNVAKQAIDTELEALHRGLNGQDAENEGRPKSRNGEMGRAFEPQDGKAEYWDPALTSFYDNIAQFREDSRSIKTLLDSLQQEIEKAEKEWRKAMGGPTAQDAFQFSHKVLWVYKAWRGIEPTKTHEALHQSKMVTMLLPPNLADPEKSPWALLKASFAFKLFYKRNPKFVWRIAGRQLQYLKAMSVDGPTAMVVPAQYVIHRPDSKAVRQIVARLGGSSTVYDNGVNTDEDDE